MSPLSAVLQSALILLAASPAHATTTLPSENAARRNAFGIFNAVHSAIRQWGSSLNHNGMSLFLATVPEGQLFYHGGVDATRPKGFEWLAFEMEHAQMFGQSRSGDDGRGHISDAADVGVWDWHVWERQHGMHLHKRSLLEEPTQKVMGATEADTKPGNGNDNSNDNGGKRPPSWPAARGYFHTYRANRPLNLLYIDGMAAGKSPFGSLDTQDLLLLGRDELSNITRPSMGEIERAQGLCALAKDWAWEDGQIDGFVRAEAGFEIIYCDFGATGGLDVAAVEASPFLNETAGVPGFSPFEYLRGVSQRYHGQPAGRIHVDWSSMVSAFFYDVNLTNPDASRPELPRLVDVARADRLGIRARVQQVVAERHNNHNNDRNTVDWQGIVDLVVTRFSNRLSQLANDTSAPLSTLVTDMLPMLIFPYINYTDTSETTDLHIDRCTNHYLSGALASESSWTPEDHSIYTAATEVTRTICTSLFDMWHVLSAAAADQDDDDGDGDGDTDSSLRMLLDELMSTLQWTTWRECDPCVRPGELCLIAMFPWGTPDDHFNPRCKTKKDAEMRNGNNYWRMGWWR